FHRPEGRFRCARRPHRAGWRRQIARPPGCQRCPWTRRRRAPKGSRHRRPVWRRRFLRSALRSTGTSSRTSASEKSRDDRTAGCRAGVRIVAALTGASQLAVAPDQRVSRAVVPKLGFRRALELGNDALRELLAEFDAPLIEGIDLPDRALSEDAVLVERHQLTQRGWRQSV